MKGYVAGIILLVLGASAFIGAISQQDSEAGGGALLFLIVGGILFYFGKKSCKPYEKNHGNCFANAQTS